MENYKQDVNVTAAEFLKRKRIGLTYSNGSMTEKKRSKSILEISAI